MNPGHYTRRRYKVVEGRASRPSNRAGTPGSPSSNAMSAPTIVEVQGRKLSLTNLDKILYPATGFTKGQVVDYYVRIAPALVPHLAGRPLTMKRYPGGVDQEYFFEKNAPMHRPDWVKTAPVWSEGNKRTINYLLANDLPTLVWIANLASIELHPSLSLSTDITVPTMIVFDLDPGPPANIVQCAQVGLWVREIFDHFGLQSFPKTSGSKGLQIYVPLNTKTTYEQTKAFAHALARLLEHEHPELVVSDMKKAVRTNKVFVDWSQNDQHKTTISVYSLRAREHATVSTPVTWEEVEQALKKKDAGRLVFEAKDVLARVEKMGDLFEAVQKLKQKLPQLAGLAAGSEKEEDEGISIAAQAEARPSAEKKTSKKTKKTTKTKGKSVPAKRRKL
jgi:bifunctional non-homologous end joining protein LigD